MKKTVGFLVVVTVLIGVLAMATQARVRPTDPRLRQAADLKPERMAMSTAGDESSFQSGYAPVGAVAANPAVDSRGGRVAQTYNDAFGNVTPGNLVAINPPTGADLAGVHFGFRAKLAPGTGSASNPLGTNRMGYACYDPAGVGTYPIPGGKVIVADISGSTSVEGGSVARVMAYPDGRAIVAGYTMPNPYDEPNNIYNHVIKDFAPMLGSFGDVNGGSIMPNDTNIAQSITAGETSVFPYSVLDINGSGPNDTIIYLATCGGTVGRYFDQMKVFRKIGTSMPGGLDNSWTIVFWDSTYGGSGAGWMVTQGIACDPTTARVAVFTTFPYLNDTTGGEGGNIRWADSPTGNPGTWTKHNLTNLTATTPDRPWLEVVGLFDSQGKLHFVFPATYYDPDDDRYSLINSVVGRGLHWSEHDPSNFYTFYDARWDPGITCGRNGSNTLNIGQLAIGECEERLYIAYSAANDPAYVPLGELGDCARSQTAFRHRGSAEIYVTVSKDLSGKSWDRPRDLSNSITGPCDTNTCAGDIYPAMTPYGMSDADYLGTESWTNSGATWDLNDPLYTGAKYLQVFYIQDKYPSRGGNAGTGGITPAWTLNDLRWVRMACAPPVVAAGLTLSRDSIAYPEWTKPGFGNDTTYKIILNASGNADLVFSSISAIMDSAKGPGAGPTGWMTLGAAPGGILEGGVDSINVTLNAGGVITSGPTVLFGKVRFTYTPPTQTKDLVVRFTVADTVVLPVWDTISTACLDLTVGSNGNMGGNYTDSVNMDYAGHGDCDIGSNSRGDETIYLGEGSVVIVRKPVPTTYIGSWAGFNNGVWLADANAFKPMTGPGYAPHGPISGSNYVGFNSGTFLTIDSLVKVERTWWAPTHVDSCNFIVERTRVFPATIGTAVTNLQIGELVDWDIPSDSGTSNNISGFDAAKRLVWLRGFNSADATVDCQDNSRRFGGTAFLSLFQKNKVCSDVLWGGHAIPNDPYIYQIAADSLSHMMHVGSYTNNATLVGDQSVLLSFKDAYTLPANDTLTIFTALATVRTSASTSAGVDSLKKAVDKAKEFMFKTVGVVCVPGTCCVGQTGNVNTLGIVDLSDLSALVSYLTGGGYVLPCQPEANVNNLGIVDLSDLSALVSYLTGGGYVLPPCPA